jgi:hypothetical protein
MIVNLTYFVQIINFLIGFWLVKRFLLKPMLSVIENKNLDQLKVENKIKILNDLVHKNQQKLSENLHNFYQTRQSINFNKLKTITLKQFFEPVEIKNNHLTKDHVVNFLLGEIDDK